VKPNNPNSNSIPFQNVQLLRWSDIRKSTEGKPEWQIDAIQALVDDEPAGHLVTRYIAQTEFDNIYPEGVMSFLKVTITPKDQERILSDYHAGEITLEEIEDEICFQYGILKNIFLEKPTIMGIETYGKNTMEYRVFPQHDRKVRVSKNEGYSDFRQIGLGGLMYREMALWMAERNLKLYASVCQSNEAVEAWNRLCRLNPDGHLWEKYMDKTRPVLDGKKIEMPIPSWIHTLEIQDGISTSQPKFG
jgi:hypothetical protein